MSFRNYLILLFFFFSSCTTYNVEQKKIETVSKINFKNKGFSLIYEDSLYENKIVSKKMNERDLIIFQRNLRKNTSVIVRNIINNKTVIAKVGTNAKYPNFNNSVISVRISKELELDFNEPYVEIIEILNNSSFIAKKSKIFDEERVVANKAPIEAISINNLNKNTSETKIKKKPKSYFKYIIKIADFYFIETANSMVERIKKETTIKEIHVKNLSETKFRVFLGPFYDLSTLQKTFNDISILKFENIEIIKNDKKIN